MVDTTYDNGSIVYDALSSIKKWGNSQGIRLPKELIRKIGLSENDDVGISINDGKLIIEKIHYPKFLSLKDRLEAFYNKPIDEIFVESNEEIETGKTVGDEIW